MKIEKMMRVPLMLAAMAAGLFFVKPVYAQQDTDPTLFEAAANPSQDDAVGFNQPVAAAPQAATATADASSTVTVQEADEASMTSAASFDINSLLGLSFAASVIVLLGIAESVRGSRRRTWKAEGTNSWANRAAAN